MDYKILLYYKYVRIDKPDKLMEAQRQLCLSLNLTGRILIASEGINGTIEGTEENTQKYIDEMTRDKRFKNINWKISAGTGNAFKKLRIRVREEIVTTGIKDKDFGPLAKVTGKYITADELYQWYKDKKEFYVIDMRNDFEFEIGRFRNSIIPSGMNHFRDLKVAVKSIEKLRGKTIVTVCTGGIRCETASGFLLKNGFDDVYQLKDGIVTFMEKYPNTFYEGKLYVFDNRETMGFNTESKDYVIAGRCRLCNTKSENLVNYFVKGKNLYGIICIDCIKEKNVKLDPKYQKRQSNFLSQ